MRILTQKQSYVKMKCMMLQPIVEVVQLYRFLQLEFARLIDNILTSSRGHRSDICSPNALSQDMFSFLVATLLVYATLSMELGETDTSRPALEFAIGDEVLAVLNPSDAPSRWSRRLATIRTTNEADHTYGVQFFARGAIFSRKSFEVRAQPTSRVRFNEEVQVRVLTNRTEPVLGSLEVSCWDTWFPSLRCGRRHRRRGRH